MSNSRDSYSSIFLSCLFTRLFILGELSRKFIFLLVINEVVHTIVDHGHILSLRPK